MITIGSSIKQSLLLVSIAISISWTDRQLNEILVEASELKFSTNFEYRLKVFFLLPFPQFVFIELFSIWGNFWIFVELKFDFILKFLFYNLDNQFSLIFSFLA